VCYFAWLLRHMVAVWGTSWNHYSSLHPIENLWKNKIRVWVYLLIWIFSVKWLFQFTNRTDPVLMWLWDDIRVTIQCQNSSFRIRRKRTTVGMNAMKQSFLQFKLNSPLIKWNHIFFWIPDEKFQAKKISL